MEKDIVLNGIHIGEHSFDKEKIEEEIYERCIKPGLNFVILRPLREKNIPQEYFVKWAKYLAENKIYFMFLYTVQHAPEGRDSYFDAETVEKIKKISGEYFIGDMIGEVGGSFTSKHRGFFVVENGMGPDDPTPIKTDYTDMKEAHEGYFKHVGNYINITKGLGMPKVISVEATSMHKYNTEAGVDMPMLELICGKGPDTTVAAIRGIARATSSEMWGTYLAHEWYGGYRHEDILKRKRLGITYKYAYMSGSNIICIESGDEIIESFGSRYEKESLLCEEYREQIDYINEFIKNDERPKGGPKVKVAFVSGLHDSWGANGVTGGSSAWNQFSRPEWGYSEAEHSWRILESIGTKRPWGDVSNHGDLDLSAGPAYGMFDIVPIEAPVDKLSQYDYLIFMGWNSMTDENMDKLTEYVQRGGRLLMCAAHLNYSVSRNNEFIMPPSEKIEKLFGCKFTGDMVNTNAGLKFRDESITGFMIYPGTKDFVCDPIYSAGYVNYARFELCGGNDVAIVSDAFIEKGKPKLPAIIENKLGDGYAMLITSANYPGHPAFLPIYNMVVREMLTASCRDCDIKVLGSDRLKYAVYEGNKVYLLNTDYDIPIVAKVICGEKECMVTLEPSELKSIVI